MAASVSLRSRLQKPSLDSFLSLIVAMKFGTRCCALPIDGNVGLLARAWLQGLLGGGGLDPSLSQKAAESDQIGPHQRERPLSRGPIIARPDVKSRKALVPGRVDTVGLAREPEYFRWRADLLLQHSSDCWPHSAALGCPPVTVRRSPVPV